MNMIRKVAARFGWVRLDPDHAQQIHNLLVEEHTQLVWKRAAATPTNMHPVHLERLEEEVAETETLIDYIFTAWRL